MTERPNILFIMTDQHNPKIAGFAGDPLVRTPALDRLADAGTVFNTAYCQQPLCVPSRTSLLVGRYCRNTGIYANLDILPANSPTFPRLLTRHGYQTCLIGKAHINGEQFQGYQQRPYGDLYGQAHQPDPRRVPEGGEHGLGEIPFQAGPSGIPLALTQTEITTAEAAKWLQTYVGRSSGQPFLLSVHYDKPHFPINPPEPYFRRYEQTVQLPDHWNGPHGDRHLATLAPFVRENFTTTGYYHVDREDHRRTLAAYYGCVEWVDDNIGRLLDVLDYLGLSENTVVIYTSDHGEMAGAHGAWQKMVFYEESARVPLIVRLPGQTGAVRHRVPVGLVDMYPTLCELAGIPAPGHCDGRSIVPLLGGSPSAGDGWADRRIYSESVLIGKPEHAGCMVRSGPWKYARYLDGAEELYNLETDPAEEQNRAADPACSEMRQELRVDVELFWEPDLQRERYDRTPRMPREKHFYEYSNQFVLGDGTIVDARP